MNKLKTISTIIILILFLSYTASAHPGRTDANGGHWNHSTGEYHYHDGKYTGRPQSESPSQNSFKEDNFSIPIKEFNDTQSKKTEETKKEAEPEDSQKGEGIFITILLIIFAVILVCCLPMTLTIILILVSFPITIIVKILQFLFSKAKELSEKEKNKSQR